MKKKIIISTLIVVFILALDQILKIWIKTHFYLGENFNLIGDKIRLRFIENPGMAFGLSWGEYWGKLFLSIFRIIAIGGLIYYLIYLIKKQEKTLTIICLSLITAGAIGNLLDCMFYGLIFNESGIYPGQIAQLFPENGGYAGFLFGKVVDMFYCPLFIFPEWIPFLGGQEFFSPIFNVADSAITIAVFIALIFYKKIFKKNNTEIQETVKNAVE
ncbi:MAG: lipoprotein signal peptidase [Bacteroidales bacterium]|jgi:signal peptidase II|nr:lipoprotein signal peptidase [Bacteroidales bacterium]